MRFLFAKPAKEAILERASNTFLKKITIHTDGACDGNPGPGGSALLRYGDHVRELAGAEPATTNNRMELQAAISGLATLKEECEVVLFTDSEYLRQGITEWLPLESQQLAYGGSKACEKRCPVATAL